MSFLSIEGSVGFGKNNNPIDVAAIQHLLKTCLTQYHRVKGRATSVLPPNIKIDGQCTLDLVKYIEQFQTTACGLKKPDGWIGPMGTTFKALIAQAKPTAATVKQLLFGPLPTNTGLLTKVKPQHLRNLISKQDELGLTLTKGEKFLDFFKFLQNDQDIKDIRWAAYILATVHHETEFSFKPGKSETGKGGNKNYGKTYKVKDVLGCRGPKNQVYNNVYYGRGYVQLTLDSNYKAIGKAYGIGDELYINPDKALEPKIAYFSTSYGMRHGTFTTLKLSNYINGKKCDYKGARQVVNGNDCDNKIANKAQKMEILLRICAASSI